MAKATLDFIEQGAFESIRLFHFEVMAAQRRSAGSIRTCG
jgi:hypothetical protein